MSQNKLFLALASLSLYACSSSQQPVGQTTTTPTPVAPVAVVAPTEPVALTVGPKQVSTTELQQVYRKNILAGDSTNAEKSVKEYAELYANFKLKVLAAEAQGVDTTTAFREELTTYRKQLVQPYLTEKNASDALVKEAYERMKEEVSASHILLNCPPDAAPQDTAKVYADIVALREKILAGEDFSKMAKANSQDPSALQNGGDLGYFTAFQMVYPFENAAFNTPKGKVSMPVRSKFGYHIVKVNDRRDSRGKIQVAHIMTRLRQNATAADKDEAKKKIDEIFKQLEKGVSFEEACRKYSEDATSSRNGGELPVFGVGEFVPEFEKAAFTLTQIGEISRPVETPYGFHIIKLLEKKSLPPLSEMQTMLRQKVQSDSRSNVGKVSFLKKIRKENQVTDSEETLKEIMALADSRLLTGTWVYDDKSPLLGKTVLSQGKNADKTTVREFFEYVKKTQKASPNASAQVLMSQMYQEFTENALMTYEENHLEEKYPEFKYLVQEYRDGILLFQMMEQNVWQKAVTDTTGLRLFYMTNRNKYQMPERVYATVVSALSKEKLAEAQKALTQKPYFVGKRLNDIQYDKNRSDLTPEIKEKLFDAIVILKKNTEYQIEISGNIDPSEADSISGSRLRKVVNYLKENGISLNRIIEKDNGKYQPVSRTERSRNQRVSFNFYSENIKDLEKYFNTEKPETLSVRAGYFKKGDDRVIDGEKWEVGKKEFDKSGRYYALDIKSVEMPRIKTFSEARGPAITDYQNYLEQDWLRKLRQQYPVKINEEELKKVGK